MRLVGAARRADEAEPEGHAPGVLFAPDSFGGWRTAPDVARRAQQVWQEAGLPVAVHPMADGGEGTAEALLAHRPGVIEPVEVTGPLRRRRRAEFVRAAGLTLVESASAIGRPPGASAEQDRPGEASSFGLGVLLCAAARRRRGALVLGLGGTVTVDGGLGLLQALGLRALDASGTPLPPGAGADLLHRVARVEGEPEALGMLEVWCDVATPLDLAVQHYGPQKGVQREQIPHRTEGLLRLAGALNQWRRARGHAPLPPSLPGGGAAGGLGWALAALDARLRPGAAAFAAHTGLGPALHRARLVLLGEGRMDATSFEGKVAGHLLTEARSRGLDVAALVGTARDVPDPPLGPDRVFEAGASPDRDAAFDAACHAVARWVRGPNPKG